MVGRSHGDLLDFTVSLFLSLAEFYKFETLTIAGTKSELILPFSQSRSLLVPAGIIIECHSP